LDYVTRAVDFDYNPKGAIKRLKYDLFFGFDVFAHIKQVLRFGDL